MTVSEEQMVWVEHDIADPVSAVVHTCTRVDARPLLGLRIPFAADLARERRALETIQWVLVSAYGYRRTARTVSRGAPSAGARYPTELLIVMWLSGAWRTLQFDFETNTFYELPESASDARIAADALGLRPGEAFVGALTILWRTIQRYGLRGHQYCIMDAACVLSNIVELCRDAGVPTTVVPPGPCASLVETLSPSASAPIVAGARLNVDHLTSAVPAVTGVRLPDGAEISAPASPPEEPPGMSPVLLRAERLHRRAQKEARQFACPYTPASLRNRAVFGWSRLRRSMRDHNSAMIAAPVHHELVDDCRALVAAMSIPGYLSLSFLYLRFTSVGDVNQRYYKAQDTMPVPLPCPVGGLDRGQLIREGFQSQAILETASSIIVLGTEMDEGETPYGRYMDLCFQTGFVIADLYRVQDCRGVNGTAIGGFSPVVIRQISGLSRFRPVMAYAFAGGRTSGGKADAVPTPAAHLEPAT